MEEFHEPDARGDAEPDETSAEVVVLSGAQVRLRTAALPALWSVWTRAVAEGRGNGAAASDITLALFDAAVSEFVAAARDQGGTVTAVLRVLDILEFEVNADVAMKQADPLRRRAGRVAMWEFYRRAVP